MKTSLLLILLTHAFFSFGQEKETSGLDISILDTSNLWSVQDTFTSVRIHESDPYSYAKSSWYKIGKDTTINSIAYKKLMNSSEPNHEKWIVSGHLRQVGNCIYLLDYFGEVLLYDFDLAIGNTMKSVLAGGQNLISRLDSVSTITLNNQVRKIYYLTEYPEFDIGIHVSEIWIEGIGSISDGLLRQTNLGFTGGENWHDYQLLCFHQNETLIYQSKEYQNCYYDIVEGISDIAFSAENIQIFPNPNFGQFSIRIKDYKTNSYLEIVNTLGAIIKEYNVESNTEINIDLTSQLKGIYFLRFRNKNGFVAKKFIIE